MICLYLEQCAGLSEASESNAEGIMNQCNGMTRRCHYAVIEDYQPYRRQLAGGPSDRRMVRAEEFELFRIQDGWLEKVQPLTKKRRGRHGAHNRGKRIPDQGATIR